MQMRRPATEQELENLTEQLIKEEIYYREAKRLGLVTTTPLSGEEWYKSSLFSLKTSRQPIYPMKKRSKTITTKTSKNIGNQRYSFKHRYFSSDRREDAKQDAEISLFNTEDLGDPFMLQKTYNKRSEREIAISSARIF